jgi:hypothetical protein
LFKETSAQCQTWTAKSPYNRFFDFIASDADRFEVLSHHIKSLGLNSVVIPVENNRHFFIFPQGKNLKPQNGGEFPFRGQSPVMLTAHYDRVPDSSGANDNSAAVFLLLETALKLDEQKCDNWVIIFTDKEELQTGETIQEQGSFSLAKKLRLWGFGKARVFNFDACGTGDTFVFSSTANYLLNKNSEQGHRRTSHAVDRLRETAVKTARSLRIEKMLSVPTPFSDDAGFLKGGMPVQTITMLPSKEAASYATLLRSNPGLADFAIAGSAKHPAAQLIPETWRCINSPLDSPMRLTPEHYHIIVHFAVELCRLQNQMR